MSELSNNVYNILVIKCGKKEPVGRHSFENNIKKAVSSKSYNIPVDQHRDQDRVCVNII